MITKITKKHLIALSFIICHLAYSSIMTSCSDDFLAEKRPYGQFGENDIYSSWESVKLRLNFIYECNLPAFRDYNKNGGNQGGNHSSNGPADQWPVGMPDFLSTHTEEFAGYGSSGYGYYSEPVVDKWQNTNIHKFF